nr:usherin [Gasterosteus aculeatus aculeatus]
MHRTARGPPAPPPTGPTTEPGAGAGGAGGAGERAEGGQGDQPLVRELWFIALMAAVALLLLAVALGVTLHKALNRPPFSRERPPLVALPMKKRNPMAVYSASNSVMFNTMPDTTGFSSGVTLKAFTMKMEEVLDAKCEAPDEVTPPAELEILSVNSLRRSVSQVMDGKSVTGDEDAWDPNISGHDSGMFMDDEEFVDTVKGFSTVRKEHTMFTDTNL